MAQKSNICRETTEGYAQWIAWGYDSVQECFGTELPIGFVNRLYDGQKEAQDALDGQKVSFNFGGHLFQIWPSGSSGNRWVLEDPSMQIHIRTEKRGWNLTIRYLAAGLWSEGVEALRARAQDLIKSEGIKPYNEHGENKDWIRLTRIDFCVDFYSPEFSKEQKPGLIAHNLLLTSGVTAAVYFSGRKNETITIGMRSQTLQIQIYDKGKELRDKAGKEWMYDIWRCGGYDAPEDQEGRTRAEDVWRFEIRFGKEFLKDRNVRTFEDFHPKHRILCSEAIDRRRMISPTLNGAYVGLDYKHRERLDLHPLWAEFDAFMYTDNREFVPRGRLITMRREAYIETLQKQQAGIGRSLSIAQYGAYDEEVAREDADKSVNIAITDKQHDKKIEKCLEKQMFLDEAR